MCAIKFRQIHLHFYVSHFTRAQVWGRKFRSNGRYFCGWGMVLGGRFCRTLPCSRPLGRSASGRLHSLFPPGVKHSSLLQGQNTSQETRWRGRAAPASGDIHCQKKVVRKRHFTRRTLSFVLKTSIFSRPFTRKSSARMKNVVILRKCLVMELYIFVVTKRYLSWWNDFFVWKRSSSFRDDNDR